MIHVGLDIMLTTVFVSQFKRRITLNMKKLLVFALGLGIALGTVSFSFAQDTTDTTKTKKAKKAKKTKSTDTTK